jgi:hypothetical protein
MVEQMPRIVATPGAQPTLSVPLSVPNGIGQILSTFGNINNYIQEDGTLDVRWQTEMLARAALPFPLTLSFDSSRTILSFTCHKRLVPVFVDVFSKLQGSRMQTRVTSFGGCFAFRPQRTGTVLSAHSWGIAIDLNPVTNQQGSTGDMDAEVIEIFRQAGFEWGGDWRGGRRDPMHFQYCTGY